MLIRKMLREMKKNPGQFISVFLLSFLAMALFITFEGHVIGQHKARAVFHKACNLSDLWIYGEEFSQKQLEAVRALDFVKSAGLRTSVTGSAPDCDGAQVDIYLENEDVVNRPYLISGEKFNPEDPDGVWLTNAFAQKRGIRVGDDFTIECEGVTFTRTVRGLIESPEYEYRQADGDADVYIENIAFVYLSCGAFPVKDYLLHQIDREKITGETLAEEEDEVPEEVLTVLGFLGLDLSSVSKSMLKTAVSLMDEDDFADMLPFTQMLVVTKDGAGLAHEEEIAQALDEDYAAMVDEDSIPGLARLDSELSQHETFSYTFVVIFVGIALLVIVTSMKRMVEQQRTQIGTLNAMGMKKSRVILHYTGYSFWVAFGGTLLGAVVGMVWLSPVMVGLFAEWYIVPGLSAGFDLSYLWVGLAIVLSCVLSAWLSCRQVLKVKPAEALRPAPPKQGKKCLFERFSFWNRLSFRSQYNLRDISRAKLRAFMCVLGTAVGMLLMIYGTACNSLVTQMEDLSFEKTQKAEYLMKLSQDADIDEIDALAEKTGGELVMTDQVEVSKKQNAVSSEKKKQTLTVTEGKGLYNILDLSQEPMELTPGTAAVSRKLSEDLDIAVGDTIYWHIYSQNDWYEAKVGAIYHSSDVQGIALLRADFEKTGAEYVPSQLYSDTDLSAYQNEDFAVSVNSKEELRAAFESSMEIINIMVYMMIGFSALMVVVVLYNSGNLSFNERIREFATLKVVGMQSSSIRKILSVQNLWLSLIGAVIGAPFGNMTFNAMMNTNGDNFDYQLKIPFGCYLISAVLVLAVSMAVSFMFSKRIRRLDMVEVLKGVE